MSRGQTLAAASAPISMVTNSNSVEFEYESIEEAFPPVEPGRKPLGHTVLVQIRQPKTKTRGGILLSQDARATEHYNTRVAKVIEVGPLCFTSTHTADRGEDMSPRFTPELVEWPEGPWFRVGDYVEVPQYGGSRFAVKFKAKREEFDPDAGDGNRGGMVLKTVTEEAVFALFKAKDIFALITGNPLQIKAYLD